MRKLNLLTVGALILCHSAFAQIPTITGFTPAKGPIGTSITITGTNFSSTISNNLVLIGGAKAIVTAAASTQLVATVPPGVADQPITVSVGGLITTSANSFSVSFPSNKVIDINSFADRVNFPADAGNSGMAMGDLDGDGKSDLAVASSTSGTVKIYRNTSQTGANPTTYFDTGVSFPSHSGASSVAIGDLDGDGKSDLVVANPGYPYTSTVSVFKNTSVQGSFSSSSLAGKVDFSLATGASSVTVGDLDLDGKPEFVVTSDGGISIYRNITAAGAITTGSFTEIDITTTGTPDQVVLADIDGDGKPELICSSNGDRVSVYRNTTTPGAISAASFSGRSDFTVGGAGDLVATDLNGDNKIDIVVRSSNGISAFQNAASAGVINGSSFLARVEYVTGTSYLTSVAIGDIDGDAKPDIAFGSRSNFGLLKNVNTGTLSSSAFLSPVLFTLNNEPPKILIADVDGDNKPDMLVSNNFNESDISLHINTSDYSLIPPIINSFAPTNGPIGTVVTIAGTGFSPTPNNNVIYFGATKANVTGASASQLTVVVPVGATYQPISVTVNGLSAYSVKSFNVSFPNGVLNASAFAAKVNFSTADTPNTIAVGDLDGDGKPDLAVANGDFSYKLSIYINTSLTGSITSTSFNSRFDFASYPSDVDEVSLRDMDGDGKLDVIITSYNPATVSIFRNISSGNFTASSFDARVDFVPSQFTYNVALADIDGDGKPDIITANSGGSTSVFRNRSIPGKLVFEKKVNFLASSAAYDIAVGDLDGDGKPEIVMTQANSISVFHNISTFGSVSAISFDPKVDFITGNAPGDVSIADLDGDGKSDIVTANNSSNNISVLFNMTSPGPFNSSSFAPHVDFATGTSPIGLTIGDVDGDGKPDIATVNNGPHTISVFKNTSTSGVVDATSLAAKVDFSSSVATDVAMGDIDGDGKPELIAINTGVGSITVLRNTVAPSPVISITSQTNSSMVCDGTMASLNVVASGTTNVGYQWQRFDGSVYTNLSNAGGYSGATSATLTFNTLGNFGAGDYRCQITGDLAAPVFSTAAAVTISGVPSQTTISVSGSNTLCNGGTATLSAPVGFASYLWSNGATTSSITVSVAGGYNVRVGNAAGCWSVVSDSVTIVSATAPPKPVIQLTGSAQLCTGSFAVIAGPAGFAAYLWSTGETSQKIVVLTAGSYSLAVGDGVNCLSPVSDPIVITETNQPCVGGSVPGNHPPEIKTATFTTAINGKIVSDLSVLITDEDDNLDLSSLLIITQPTSGAVALITDTSNLVIDYSATQFAGTEVITIQVCDFASSCTEQQLTLEVASDIEAFNGFSPNGDGKNEVFYLQYIDLIPETKDNVVTIYNRWGDKVFSMAGYDNDTHVFKGLDDNGKELPAGTYYYNIEFTSGRKKKAGFVTMRR